MNIGQDPGTSVMGELSFAVGLKNLVLDTTSIAGGKYFLKSATHVLAVLYAKIR